MRKNIFKFGAALTAAMMVFSATASLAFADEVETATEPETVVSDVVEAPVEETADTEEPEEAEEVQIPLETEEITVEDMQAEAEVEAAAAVADVATGSSIDIQEANMNATVDDNYYTVSVPFTATSAPAQMSFFVYDITKIAGNQNNQVGFSAETPVGYINQYAGAAEGTYTFKLSKADYNENSIIVVKIGGTGVATPDAASYSLKNASQGGGDVLYGDINNDGSYDTKDTLLVLQYGANKIQLTGDQAKAADVNLDGSYDTKDTLLILQYGAHKITELPQPVK